MESFTPYVLFIGTLLLVTLSAWAVARKAWSSQLARGKTEAWIASIIAFVISFFGFAFVAGALVSLTFGR
jgi:hypothetical protein